MANTYEYDFFHEGLVFWHVVETPNLLKSFDDYLFSKVTLQHLFKIIKNYKSEYGDKENINEELINMLAYQQGISTELTPDIVHAYFDVRKELSKYSKNWLTDLSKGFFAYQNMISGINDVTSFLMSQSEISVNEAASLAEQVNRKLQNISKKKIRDEHDYSDFFDIESHVQTKVDRKPSGYSFIDLCLNGGWAKQTLNVLMGPPKVGKSLWLCNLCANSIKNGQNCVYITLEMSAATVNQRIGSNLFNIPIKDYEHKAQDREYMKAIMTNFCNSCGLLGKPGALVVKEFPTSSATAEDIEAFICGLEEERSTPDNPFKFDCVFIDYINIMADCRSKKSDDNMYQKIKNIAEDVRAMSQKNDWCVISLTQTNRQGMNCEDPTMENVSESAGLVATVDSLFAIVCSTMMKADGYYYLKAIALRNSNNMGDKKRYDFSNDYLRLTESNEGIIPEGTQEKKEQTPKYKKKKDSKPITPAPNMPVIQTIEDLCKMYC